MSIKITSGASLQRMENAIVQANKALDHSMETGTKEKWALLAGMMRVLRKEAIEKNEKHKELTK